MNKPYHAAPADHPIHRIAVVGATGKLAVPVVEALVGAGYAVRALVRDLAKAQKLLPPAVELVRADLREPATLVAGLHGQEAVYLNLATETDRLNLPFYEEREGVRNVVEAAQQSGLRHIFKIGAGGAYPDNVQPGQPNAVPNVIRLAGQRYIEESGIPYTIFDPTMFFDNLPLQLRGDKLQWIGPTSQVKNYWLSARDYAGQVVAAINNPQATNRHYLMQGPELLSPQEVFDRFANVYNPNIKVQSFPLGLVKVLGLFNPKMRFMGHMFTFFGRTKEEVFRAQQTWADLGRPTDTVEQYAARLKAG